ncbi:MAG: tRNA (adenosine(37)-N6)-threonylcarbamoyltransferase complex dimerization subunit type 1 TsaB [Mariprofundaceae bacterium]
MKAYADYWTTEHAMHPPRACLLALDTATDTTALALRLPDGEWRTAESGDRARSRTLVPMIKALLDRAGIGMKELTMLAFAHGPGSFTGLRIGAATLAGLNAGFHRPCLGFSALAVTARQADANDTIRVVEDARAGQVHLGCYAPDGTALQDDACVNLDDLVQITPGPFAACRPPEHLPSGWTRLPLRLSRADALARAVEAAESDPHGVCAPYPLPRYLQPSQAERLAHA